MDAIGEYHAKWNKPIAKNLRLNVFPDKWMMIHNGGGGLGVREEWRNFRLWEGNEREEVAGVWKMVKWDGHHYLMYMYDYVNSVDLHHVQP